MDDTDDYVELGDNDRQARRLLSLALGLMNAGRPLTADEIARDYYPDMEPDSRRKAFRRDRQALALAGVVVGHAPGTTDAWQVDAARSYAADVEVPFEDALAVDVACRPLLADPTFPMRDDLRLALAKVNTAFGDVAHVEGGEVVRDGHVESTVRACVVGRHALRMSYVDARGTRSERIVAPYGLYGLRGSLYLVAPLVDDGEVVPGSLRTYNCARIAKATALPKVAFDVPEDFSVDDWRRLPFQLGPTTCRARFRVPSGRVAELRRASLGRGELAEGTGGATWEVDVSDVDAAVSWAVAEGIAPLSPEPLVAAWRRLLEGVVAR